MVGNMEDRLEYVMTGCLLYPLLYPYCNVTIDLTVGMASTISIAED